MSLRIASRRSIPEADTQGVSISLRHSLIQSSAPPRVADTAILRDWRAQARTLISPLRLCQREELLRVRKMETWVVELTFENLEL